MERISIDQYRKLIANPGAVATSPRPLPQRKGPQMGRRDISLARILSPSPVGKLVLKPEEQIAAAFGATLRDGALTGQLHAVFCHVPNEIAGRKRSRTAQIRYTIAKAMGLIEGAPDYLFLWNSGSGALEAKTDKGRQTDGQLAFESWCAREGVPYRIFRSPEEGLNILEEWGVWKRQLP